MAERPSRNLLKTPRCELNSEGCLNLSDILRSFNSPINEEQAWAICYQCSKCFTELWANDPRNCAIVLEPEHVQLFKDGTVHPSTLRPATPPVEGRERATTEAQLVDSLGRVIYQALDFGLGEDEERHLSPPLSSLIDKMTCSEDDDESSSLCNGHEADDEGIEEDQIELDDCRTKWFTLNEVLEHCSNHLSNPSQADAHYRAVCRALVTEVLELSTFLEKISQGTQELRRHADEVDGGSSDLENLHINDWARLWVQVIHELRTGVKLKKVEIDPNPHPIEYALTPYEILMDDIRRRRYKLKKIMVNGDIPRRVKKDAHAIILDFIRSRPPLVPVSKRRLPPAPTRTPSPYEELMTSIRQEHRLKPTPGKTVETSRTKLNDSDLTPQPTRRLIKADLSLLNISSFDQDDDDFLNSPSPDVAQKEFPGTPSTERTDGKSPWQRTVCLDLTTQSVQFKPERRYSLAVCQSPPKPKLPDEIQWKHSLECLSLTLEEVVHIRNQLTKAELESLLVDTPQYVDVAKGKLCFICKRTKFGFFGPWGQKCKLCKRIVCEKCCSKMRIPTEHFARIPVYTLSPSPTSSSDEDSSPRSSWRMPELPTLMPNSAGSAPSSPMTPARAGREPQEAQPSSLPTIPATPDTPCVDASDFGAAPVITQPPPPTPSVPRRGPLLRSRTLQRPDRGGRQEKLCGSLMNVCKECKAMVCHIIVASHNSLVLKQKSDRIAATFPRRIKAPTDSAAPSRDLNLNLSPIY